MPDTPSCYGTLFPDLDRLEYNTPCRGKAFTVMIRSQGVVTQAREVTVDPEAWVECQACPVFRSCYDLAMALFVLRESLARR